MYLHKKIARVSFILILGCMFSFCLNNHSQEKITWEYPNPASEWLSKELSDLNFLPLNQQYFEFEKSITLLKNKDHLLPLGRLDLNIGLVNIGGNPNEFLETSELFISGSSIHAPNFNLISAKDWSKIIDCEIILLSLHANVFSDGGNIIDLINSQLFEKLPKSAKIILSIFGDEEILQQIETKNISALILGKENNKIAQSLVCQTIFGSLSISGKTNNEIKSKDQIYPSGFGIEILANGRLKFSQASEIVIDAEKLSEIDQIALNGIRDGAYPGCQILVAVDNQIIYRKSFGNQTYEKDAKKVENDDVYDIASITKIAASTLLAMHLQTQDKFNLNKKLKDYIPELINRAEYGEIGIREMMAHQAGLTPWIPFYKRTLKNGELNPLIYNNLKSENFKLQVAENIFIKPSYVDSMYAQIFQTPLGAKKYVYSDLCYYFTQKILEKQINSKQDEYLRKNIYGPLGLRYARYLPLNYFPKSKIIPTENDIIFRKQLIHGHVHDPGAAMLGGVAGHAGLFCNATDLASIMNLFLQKGKCAGMTFFDEKTINEYTKAQFSGNRRGAGFDRPNSNGGGPCDILASQESFGHSGFTGTLAWADPKDKVIFIFLSNRVNPDAENWKLSDLNIRTKIQHVVYEAVQSRKK
jgi:beta-N-acetylhexosaminidase